MWQILQEHPVETVTLVGTVITVIATLIGIWWQMRKQWLLHSASMVTSLSDRYDSADMRVDRKTFNRMIVETRNGQPADFLGYLPVLLFFEHIGHLVRRHALDKLMVWNRFGWEVLCYYTALTRPSNKLEEIRKKETDESVYEEFEWLSKHMSALYSRRGITGATQPTDAQVDRFLALEWEKPKVGSAGDGSR